MLVVSGICQAKNRVLQSIIFSTAAFCSKWNRVSRSRFAVNGIPLMTLPYLETWLMSMCLQTSLSEEYYPQQPRKAQGMLLISIEFFLRRWNSELRNWVRARSLRWQMHYCRCLRNHLKCHFFQIELNNQVLHMLQQSIKVSLIAVNVRRLSVTYCSKSAQIWSRLRW